MELEYKSTVSKLLGHTRISTTEIYADVIMTTKEQAVNRMNSNFRARTTN